MCATISGQEFFYLKSFCDDMCPSNYSRLKNMTCLCYLLHVITECEEWLRLNIFCRSLFTLSKSCKIKCSHILPKLPGLWVGRSLEEQLCVTTFSDQRCSIKFLVKTFHLMVLRRPIECGQYWKATDSSTLHYKTGLLPHVLLKYYTVICFLAWFGGIGSPPTHPKIGGPLQTCLIFPAART